ncbi:MAG: hypothetical protein QXD14_05350 [Sulfolobales archaeon]
MGNVVSISKDARARSDAKSPSSRGGLLPDGWAGGNIKPTAATARAAHAAVLVADRLSLREPQTSNSKSEVVSENGDRSSELPKLCLEAGRQLQSR